MSRYRINPYRSTVTIDATSSVHPIHSEARGLEGWVEFEVGADGSIDLSAAASGHLEFPVEGLRGGNPLEERELKRRIDARSFPTIAGEMTSMAAASASDRYVIGGDLTFRGVTRACWDEMQVEQLDDRTVRLTGSSVFDVRDYGMDPPRILMLRVHPEVTVAVDLTAEIND